MINMGRGYSKKDQRRVAERNAPHKCLVEFKTLTNVQNCSPILYDTAYAQTYTNYLTKLVINPSSVVYKNYATRYSEYKVDSIDITVYYNLEARIVDDSTPPIVVPGPASNETFKNAFFHFLYNPEKDHKPGEQLGTVQEYDQLTAHPSTKIFRWRPPYVTDNSQTLARCFQLRVKPKVEKTTYIDGQPTEVYVNHPFIDTGAPPKELYCGGLWVWTSHEVDERYAPIFFAEIQYNMIFRDSEFNV